MSWPTLEALQRLSGLLRFFAMVGAAVVLTLNEAILVFIIWRGGWPINQAPRQLDILGKALWINLAMILVILAALTAQRISAKSVLGSLDVGTADDPRNS